MGSSLGHLGAVTPKSSGLRLGRPSLRPQLLVPGTTTGNPWSSAFPIIHWWLEWRVPESCPLAGLHFSLVQTLHLPLHNKNCFPPLFLSGTSARWAGLSLHFKDEIKALERKVPCPGSSDSG